MLLLLAVGCTTPPPPAEAPSARVSDYRAPAGLLLAAPTREGQEAENRTFRVLEDLIAHTPAGERIRIVGSSFSYVPVAEALVAAHERGVQVQVLLHDVANRGWKAPEVLRAGLGQDPEADSWVRLAPGGLHQKVWSFTRTGRSRDVTLTGSMNLTYHSAGQYTDMWSWVDRPDVRRALDRRFDQLVRGLPDPPPAGPRELGRERIWFHPGRDGAPDPVAVQLAAVPPEGARIRVVMYAWLDERGLDLARLLVAKDRLGADVEVVLGRSTGPQVRDLLVGSGVEVHPGVFEDGDDVHHKLTVVAGPGRGHDFALTGSDNFTQASLGRPELLLRLDRPQALAAYDRWIDRLIARGEREQAGGN
ncbi:hypothetical protein GCM10009623_04880 [Nocardioides aestuarii]|uniref:phospholipase D n=1 Tax=Nocardioides aestuarii TaxID=252231 RepID=A0ABW4TFZ6_9ACTN